MRKCFLDRGDAFKNVRMVELQVVDDRHFRQVMDEFAPFIEKSRVVFVALDDKPFALGESGPLPQIVWNAADEIARMETLVLEDPREQRRRRRLAVRASHYDGAFAAVDK